MKQGRISGLFLLLWMGFGVNGEEAMTIFIRDVLSTFRLTSPTIIYDGNEVAPEVCYLHQWVLCLPSKILPSEASDPKELANDSESAEATDGMLHITCQAPLDE